MKSQCYAPSLSSRKKIKSILNADESIIGQTVVVCGWIRTLRDQKTFAFIELTDGSSFSNFQVIAQIDMIENLSTGAAVAISGEIVKSPGNKQKYEMQAKELKLIGACPNDYPLQKNAILLTSSAPLPT